MTEPGREYRTPEEGEPLNVVPDDMKARYKLIFQSQVGTYVLANLLWAYGLFNILDAGDPEQIARHNAAIELLGLVGILRPDSDGKLSQTDMEKIVEALSGIEE